MVPEWNCIIESVCMFAPANFPTELIEYNTPKIGTSVVDN